LILTYFKEGNFLHKGRNDAVMMLVTFLFLVDVIAIAQFSATNPRYNLEITGQNGPNDTEVQPGKTMETNRWVQPLVHTPGPDNWEMGDRPKLQEDQGSHLTAIGAGEEGNRATSQIAVDSYLSEVNKPSHLVTEWRTNCSIILNWTEPTICIGLTEYVIHVSESSSFETILRNITLTSCANNVTISDLRMDTEYYFRVQGLFNGTGGPFSTAVQSGHFAVQDEANKVDTNLLIGTALVVAFLAVFDFMTLYRRMKGRIHH
jgi:hypothetical protein